MNTHNRSLSQPMKYCLILMCSVLAMASFAQVTITGGVLSGVSSGANVTTNDSRTFTLSGASIGGEGNPVLRLQL